jgi:hypothetical protein
MHKPYLIDFFSLQKNIFMGKIASKRQFRIPTACVINKCKCIPFFIKSQNKWGFPHSHVSVPNTAVFLCVNLYDNFGLKFKIHFYIH